MPTIRSELEQDTNVFYVTSQGYAADHWYGWLPKALNAHPEIFALLAHEGSRPKYIKTRTRGERPSIIPFTEFPQRHGYDLSGNRQIRRLTEYLGLPDNPEIIADIVEATDFDKMKKNTQAKESGSHFRRGAPGGHRETLKEHHPHMVFGRLSQFAPELWTLTREREFHEITQRLG